MLYRKYIILGNETIHCFINNNDYKSVHTKGGTSQNHPLFLWNQPKPAIKFNKNIPAVPNLAGLGPKN